MLGRRHVLEHVQRGHHVSGPARRSHLLERAQAHDALAQRVAGTRARVRRLVRCRQRHSPPAAPGSGTGRSRIPRRAHALPAERGAAAATGCWRMLVAQGAHRRQVRAQVDVFILAQGRSAACHRAEHETAALTRMRGQAVGDGPIREARAAARRDNSRSACGPVCVASTARVLIGQRSRKPPRERPALHAKAASSRTSREGSCRWPGRPSRCRRSSEGRPWDCTRWARP